MEEVSKGDHVVQTKPLIPLALPQTRRVAGCCQHGPPATKRPGLFPTSFCCFHQNPPAIITLEWCQLRGRLAAKIRQKPCPCQPGWAVSSPVP